VNRILLPPHPPALKPAVRQAVAEALGRVPVGSRRDFAAERARAIETARRRGETLEQDGYSIDPYEDRPGVYCVTRPEGRPLPKGCSLWNDVDLLHGDCTCAAFENLGTCKHLCGVTQKVSSALRLVAPMLPVGRRTRA
jgi:hypothetical protein